MSAELTMRIDAIAAMPPTAIKAEWERVHDAPAPAISPSLLARDIAWAIQAKISGGIDKRIERHLARLCAASEADESCKQAAPPPELSAGTQILREWGGKTHRVSVGSDGRFAYAGRSYRSLSAIARDITGARWSGPRFFGVPT